jgi:hypothetical protein
VARIDTIDTAPFIDGPLEFVCANIKSALDADPKWRALFGASTDAYCRMDYSMRELPALRIYSQELTKQFDSWFIEGDILMDAIFPAGIRRNAIQQIQDTVSAALLQQFRRQSFFDAIASGTPGLNELGKTFSMDKALSFEFGDTNVPLTQIRANVRLDLREWDLYLEGTERTKDSPFDRVLGELRTFKTQLDAETEAVEP